MKQLYSVHKRTVKVLTPISNMDYKQKYSALKLLSLDKQLFFNNKKLNVFYFKKVVHGKASQYLKDLTITSELLHVHGNKQFLPGTID